MEIASDISKDLESILEKRVMIYKEFELMFGCGKERRFALHIR